jgi:O-acetylhomoserine (thiol)-lyase
MTYLQNHRDVARVIYAGLHEDAEQRRRANIYLKGFGGIVGFELKQGREAGAR